MQRLGEKLDGSVITLVVRGLQPVCFGVCEPLTIQFPIDEHRHFLGGVSGA